MKLKQRGHWEINSEVEWLLYTQFVGGSNPSFPIALRGNTLFDTGVRVAPDPFHGSATLESTEQGNPRTNLNNIVSFRRTAVAA